MGGETKMLRVYIKQDTPLDPEVGKEVEAKIEAAKAEMAKEGTDKGDLRILVWVKCKDIENCVIQRQWHNASCNYIKFWVKTANVHITKQCSSRSQMKDCVFLNIFY